MNMLEILKFCFARDKKGAQVPFFVDLLFLLGLYDNLISLTVFNWRQIFALHSAVVKAIKLFSSRGGFVTYVMEITEKQSKLIKNTMMKHRKWRMTHR